MSREDRELIQTLKSFSEEGYRYFKIEDLAEWTKRRWILPEDLWVVHERTCVGLVVGFRSMEDMFIYQHLV